MGKLINKAVILILGTALTLSASLTSLAAEYSTPDSVAVHTSNKASISVGKEVKGLTAPASFQFRIDAIEAYNSDAEESIPKAGMPLPGGEVKTISFTSSDISKSLWTKGTSFTEMTFTAPGYYLYRVAEVVPDNPIKGIQYDDSYYYICVYVGHQTDGDGRTLQDLEVREITSWHNRNGENPEKRPDLSDLVNIRDDGAASTEPANNAADNSAGNAWGKVNFTKFVNVQSSSDIMIHKTVKGNLGNRLKDFEFIASLEGLNPNTEYSVEKNMTAGGAPSVSTFTASADGTAAVEFSLKHNEDARFLGLPVNAKYIVTEKANNHTASFTIEADGNAPVIAMASSESKSPATNFSTSKETIDTGDGNVTINFNNTRELAPITGVKELDNGLYLMGMFIVIVLAFMVLSRRAKSEDSEPR